MKNKFIRAVRGMVDCLPEYTFLWQKVEDVFKKILDTYGYREIRLPILEKTILFNRAIGDSTDVVTKEMYTFKDCHGVSLTLRPEGTAGCVRAVIENGLFNSREQRLWYVGPMFRRERPQYGRYRQFHQFNVEVFGQRGPDIDFELIMIIYRFWNVLGIKDHMLLELNSIGSLKSRLLYRKALTDFFSLHLDKLDANSLHRFYHNPIRLLDTKNLNLQDLVKSAPSLYDYLDECSRIHFLKLCKLLDLSGIKYVVNPCLVRGLDYYNRTVFEWFFSNDSIKRKAICAGGRYDLLSEQLGGPKIPAIGFAVGLERLILLMSRMNVNFFKKFCVYLDIYLIPLGEDMQGKVIFLAERIRNIFPSLRLIVDHGGGNLKKQLRRANINGARVVLILGEKECLSKNILFKDLSSGYQENLKENDLITRLSSIFKL